MKKLILFLLLSVASYGQVSTGNETYFDYGTQTAPASLQIPATVNYLGTYGTDGTSGRITPLDVTIPYIPISYVPATFTLGGHITGIDNKLNTISATTAGQTTRVWFTADQTTITAGTFDLTNPTSKGTAPSHIQSVVNDDNEKKYFLTDVIGGAFIVDTMFPPGIYAGNLSASTTPNSAQQRWTVELYKCDNGGTPIASGVTGAVVGSLGVTVITILDSGLLTLADGSIANVQVSGNLGGTGFSILAGQRVRYHVSAEKVGTAASNITQSVYYGTYYNSFIDVTVPLNTNGITNGSLVTGETATDALNNLKASIPENYTKTVYVNATNPNSATIFDLNNPPVTNDDLLKADVNNLYIGSDSSTWVYNSTSLTYTAKVIPSTPTVFYNTGTTTPATNTTSPIVRSGNINTTGRLTVGTSIPTETNVRVNRDISGSTSSNSILVDGVIKSDVTNSAFLNKSIAITEASVFTVPNLYHNYASQGVFGAGSAVTNQYGFYADVTLLGATNNYGFYGAVSLGGNRWNAYMNGTAPNYFNGNVSIGTTSQTGKLLVVTGIGNTVSVTGQPTASVVLGNLGTSTNEMPAVIGKTTNNTGLTMMASSEEVNSTPDMRFEIRRNTNTDYTDRTTTGWKFTRFGTTVIDILRNGNTTFIGSVSGIAATTANHFVIKSQFDLKADLASPILTGDPKAPTATAGDNDTSIATTAFVATATGNYKKYVALLTQTGTSAPTATVLENTLGGTVVWTRTSTGEYKGTLTGAFTTNKTFFPQPSISLASYILAAVLNTNELTISSRNTSGVSTDALLTNSTIEIRVYP